MEITNLVTVVPIMAICYFLGLGVKAFKIKSRFIPIITGSFGAVLGVLGYFTMDSFPANDLVTAIAIGIISGLASTGFNETLKTITKKNSESDNDKQQQG